MLIREITSILYESCFYQEQLFYPVKCTAFKICQCNSLYKLILQVMIGILSILLSLRYELFQKRYTTLFNLSVSFLKFTPTFSLLLHTFYFRQKKSSLGSAFSISGECGISTSVSAISVSFHGENYGVVSTTC